MTKKILSALIACVLAEACGSSSSEPHSVPPTLTARAGHAMAYDEARHHLLLFGGTGTEGSTASGDRNSLWQWDGTSWTRIATDGPAPRHNASLAYDAARQQVVLYGGRAGAFPNETILTDTWIWDGTGWHQAAATGPSPRVHQQIAYDRSRNRVILYGGYDLQSNQELVDIWEWDGTSWNRVLSSTSAQRAIGVAFDEQSSTLLLFSEAGGQIVVDGWDGSSLSRLPESPSACIGQPVAVGTRGLVSTEYCAATSSMQTYLRNRSTWTTATASEPAGPRINCTMAYDRARDRLVLFGGEGLVAGSAAFSDTWEWDGTSWSRR